ncbi:hypothetical protein GIB67_021052 [Kingdonia uniflora]|uniref:Acid phosphatase n=1 Tax=Kingdonia uniflora TaxID=39325 RepID=A0A7J7N742_9MAGN|nr:hypothetical protein GIB67_021052 [Kingdonia uniflora]
METSNQSRETGSGLSWAILDPPRGRVLSRLVGPQAWISIPYTIFLAGSCDVWCIGLQLWGSPSRRSPGSCFADPRPLCVSAKPVDFITADLAKVDRRRTPWLLALFHVPWYNSNKAHQCEGDSMMASMEPLLYTAGVDIMFAGHVHAYERSKRVNNGKYDPCGAVHITIGDGGNREGLAQKYDFLINLFQVHFVVLKKTVNYVNFMGKNLLRYSHRLLIYLNPSPEWSVFREASFGHGELKIVNSTHTFWSWHRNDDDEPVKSDQVWITSLASSGCLKNKSHELRKILFTP